MSVAHDFEPDLYDSLKALLGDRLSVADAVRDHHARDMSRCTMPNRKQSPKKMGRGLYESPLSVKLVGQE